MDITNYLNKESVIFAPRHKSKESIISFILDKLIDNNKLDKKNKKEILATIIQIEEMGSTAIGGNIAFPHARISSITNVILSVCIVRDGVDFDSLDEKPVYIIVLLLSSKTQAGIHLKTLAFLARMLKDNYFVQQLQKSESREDVVNLLNKQQKAVS